MLQKRRRISNTNGMYIRIYTSYNFPEAFFNSENITVGCWTLFVYPYVCSTPNNIARTQTLSNPRHLSYLNVPVLAAGAQGASVRAPAHAHNGPHVGRYLGGSEKGEEARGNQQRQHTP